MPVFIRVVFFGLVYLDNLPFLLRSVRELALDNFHRLLHGLALRAEYHVGAQVPDNEAILNIFKNPSLIAPTVANVLDDGHSFLIWAFGHIDDKVGQSWTKYTASVQVLIDINFFQVPVGNKQSRIKGPHLYLCVHATGTKIFWLILTGDDPKIILTFCDLCPVQLPTFVGSPVSRFDCYLLPFSENCPRF